MTTPKQSRLILDSADESFPTVPVTPFQTDTNEEYHGKTEWLSWSRFSSLLQKELKRLDSKARTFGRTLHDAVESSFTGKAFVYPDEDKQMRQPAVRASFDRVLKRWGIAEKTIRRWVTDYDAVYGAEFLSEKSLYIPWPSQVVLKERKRFIPSWLMPFFQAIFERQSELDIREIYPKGIKCRFDLLVPGGHLFDIKTTESHSLRGLHRDMRLYGYYGQVMFYVLCFIMGQHRVADFSFVFLSKAKEEVPPFIVTINPSAKESTAEHFATYAWELLDKIDKTTLTALKASPDKAITIDC